MATLANNSSGNFTSASTWSVCDPTSLLDSELGSTVATTVFSGAVAFTPGAITIDGIGLKILQGSTTTTGTFSVRLAVAGAAVAGTTVTINVTDLHVGVIGGWIFFKFASPVTLLAATAYSVQIASSTTGTVTVYRSLTAADWSRYLRTTTTQAPAASDILYVTGEHILAGVNNVLTVTMDNTSSTVFGVVSVGKRGVLAYGVASSTAYKLRLAGNLVVGAGTFTMGTAASPVPSTSSALLEMVVASNNQYTIITRGIAVFTTYGATKTGRAYLAADVPVAATSFTTDISTGWVTGDSVVLASTSTVSAQSEQFTLTGNASGTSVPISAVAFIHTGTAPYIGEVINLTRNVKIIGQSAILQSNITMTSATTISFNYTEFAFLTNITPTVIAGTTFSAIGCAFRNFEFGPSNGLVLSTLASPTISDCVFYRIYNTFISTTGTLVNINNCWAITSLGTGTQMFAIGATSGTVSNLTAVGANTTMWGFGVTAATDPSILSVSNLVAHSSAGYAGGYFAASSTVNGQMLTISNITVWRCAAGIQMAANNATIDNFNCHSNTTTGVYFTSGVSHYVLIKNSTFNGGTAPVQPSAIGFFASSVNIFVENCTFGVSSALSLSDIRVNGTRLGVTCFLRDCTFGATPVGLASAMSYDSFIASSKHNGVDDTYNMYKHTGNISRDTVIADSSPASTKMIPATVGSVEKLKTPLKSIIVPAGKALRITAAVRTSVIGDGATYNGALPRLILQKNNAQGLTADSILATATAASSGAFENITGTTPIATENGTYSVYVDCSGTTGFINIDTWKVEIV